MNILSKYQMYPVLSENSRLVKMSDCCALIDRIYGSYVLIEPYAAAIVAMCNGAISLEKLLSITEEFLPVSSEKANEMTLKTIEKAKEHLYWNNTPQKLHWQYNPSDFLYETTKRQDNILLPLEKPLQMTLVLTNECNFECIYCFRSAKDKWENELSKEEIFNLIDQAAELEVKYCSLTGGEPTLNPYFEDVVIKLLENDIYPYISSNGTNITEKTLVTMKKAGLQTIQFSMDSADTEIFNKMVGVKGYFESLISSIKKAKKLGYVVRIKGVLSELNVSYIEQLFETCSKLKVDYVFLEPFSPGLDGRGNRNLILSRNSAEKIKRIIQEAKDKYSPDTVIMPVNVQNKWANAKDIIYCGGMYTSFIVQSDGTVGVCEQANHPSLCFGNIRDKNIKDIWASKEVIGFLNPDKLSIKGVCKDCESFDKCRSGCFNFSLQYTENLFAPDPRCWKVNLGSKDPLNLQI
ncbi:MAG: radical SAM protein [Cyanobacteriota bacterium]